MLNCNYEFGVVGANMDIRKKLMMDLEGLIKNGAITVVVFGDSVSYGAVGIDEIDYDSVYWNRLRIKMNNVRKDVPVNVINSAIGATTATSSLARMEKQVFSHNPDLLIVSFGLNDINDDLNTYLSGLRCIFERAKKDNIETIFMTANMLNTYVADDTRDDLREYAAITAEYQNSGKMDKYMSAACELAVAMGVKVCDCYSKWKQLSITEDTTMLLANRINHPIREMHELFAQSLFETIFSERVQNSTERIDTMWKTK